MLGNPNRTYLVIGGSPIVQLLSAMKILYHLAYTLKFDIVVRCAYIAFIYSNTFHTQHCCQLRCT